jgi:hypothetical protein
VFDSFAEEQSPPGGDPGPQSVRAVASLVSGLGAYDGVSAVFPGAGRRGRPVLTRAFADRRLRLAGAVPLTVRVEGRRR